MQRLAKHEGDSLLVAVGDGVGVARRQGENIFCVAPDFAGTEWRGTDDKGALVRQIVLRVGENHDGNVLVGMFFGPMRMANGNLWALFVGGVGSPSGASDREAYSSRPLVFDDAITLPAFWHVKPEAILFVGVDDRVFGGERRGGDRRRRGILLVVLPGAATEIYAARRLGGGRLVVLLRDWRGGQRQRRNYDDGE